MSNFPAKLSLTFCAGCLGGLINGLFVWGFGAAGIAQALGVHIAPPLTPPLLYQKMVWGGIWGWLFLVPLMNRSLFWRGLVWSLGPTLVQLFIVFPLQAKKGVMGLELGYLTPLFVVFYNAVWGWVASYWLAFSGYRRSRSR